MSLCKGALSIVAATVAFSTAGFARAEETHLRMLALGTEFSINESDKGRGGMVFTLPLGVGMDWGPDQLLDFSLYGPGVNWAGFARNQAWSPVILGAAKVGLQYVLKPRAIAAPPHTSDEWVFGIDFLTAITGDALAAQPRNLANDTTFGFAIDIAYTPPDL